MKNCLLLKVFIPLKPTVIFSRSLRSRGNPCCPTAALLLLCLKQHAWAAPAQLSQRSLHSAPIFRLLLKVAVNGTHQCDFHNFCGASCSNRCVRQRRQPLCVELLARSQFNSSPAAYSHTFKNSTWTKLKKNNKSRQHPKRFPASPRPVLGGLFSA